MVRVALIADIHGNLEALESVLTDIQKNGITDTVSLGDNVGYGPNPVEVLRNLHKRDIVTIEGNHDLAVVNPKSFADATDLAMDALEWTRRQLMDEIKKDPKFEEILNNYLGTPDCIILPDDPRVTIVHGCPGDIKSRFEYLLNPEDFIKPCSYMRKKKMNMAFFGHTHRQVLWEVDEGGVSLIDFDIDEPITFTDKELAKVHLFINPGSVGQPRDQNPDAAYLIYETKKDGHILTFKRVSYDIPKTVDKIYAIEALDKRLGDRLTIGA